MKSIAADLLPYPSAEIRVGDFTQRYLDEGDGDETLLCVHGNPTWSFYYRGIIERFRDTHRVVAVDHLGCGRSDKPRRDQFGYTMADHRDNLVALIDQLDLKNITLIAHDWGGAIGLSSLVARRERFNRIVLLNTGAFPPPYVPKRIGVLRTPLLGSAAIRGLNLFAGPAVKMAMSRNQMSPDVARGLLAPYNNWANRVAVDSFVRDIPLSQNHPTYATLRQLEMDLPKLADLPSLLVWGMKDWCFNDRCLQHFQTVWPDAKTVEIADAGHYVIEDAPTETIDAIADFVSSASPS
ncbi:alpha/beta fold hydrolase [Planctomycetes bacterium K23_9]|uniref:Haloalkane dehalogenase n=1 Tax=Stieleria marina TaxID=1930275 RepID=A0A517NWY5_9BACT|nr:Haloalkane dehalogenase [Planctomycetes bacterium K23_9]